MAVQIMNAPDTKPLGGTAIMNPSHDKQSTFETALQESESGFSATNPEGFKIDESYSNRKLLCISFFTFMSFALAQTTAALIAGSQAMLADSITMMVDSFAYIFNWYAERQKGSYANNLNGHKRSVLLYRKYTYQLELLPPLLSVLILLVLTIYIARGAVKTLILDIERDESEQATPNVKLMIAFSGINLCFDLFNVFCFVRARHGFGYKTKLDPDEIIPMNKRPTSTTKSQSDYGDSQEDGNADMEDGREDETSKGMQSLEIESYGYSRDGHRHDHGDESSNLNMCSAYTHVVADTFRSIAVLLAGLVATFVPSITSEEADAGASIIVSIFIFITLFPLLSGMLQTLTALRNVNKLLKSPEFETDAGEWTDKENGFSHPQSSLV